MNYTVGEATNSRKVIKEDKRMNSIKTVFLMGALFGMFMLIGGLLGGQGGMMMAFIFALVMNFSMYWFSDTIVLKMYRAQELPQDRAPRIYEMVQKLSSRADIPVPRVFYVPMPVPNAFATGRDPAHGVVAVTKGLLEMLDDRELEGVIAHEIGHIKNRDTLISCFAAAIAGAIMMMASWARWGAIFGRDDDNNIVELIVMAIVAPIAAMLIQMGISRSREYMADEAGARMSRDPQALASALVKISEVAKKHPIRDGNNATSHMFIINPFKAGMISGLFSTHPSVEERVKRLSAMDVI